MTSMVTYTLILWKKSFSTLRLFPGLLVVKKKSNFFGAKNISKGTGMPTTPSLLSWAGRKALRGWRSARQVIQQWGGGSAGAPSSIALTFLQNTANPAAAPILLWMSFCPLFVSSTRSTHNSEIVSLFLLHDFELWLFQKSVKCCVSLRPEPYLWESVA